MTENLEYKTKCLDFLREKLLREIPVIRSSSETHQNKARSVNALIAGHRNTLASEISSSLPEADRQRSLIILQYCISVVSLEYRHAVWPYEYMALSRRVGELWERFCCSAWDVTSRPNLQRITPPSFQGVLSEINERLLNAADESQKDVVSDIFHDLRDLIGEINMVEDEVFTWNGIPHVIDFKSGFGSNERGNMLRLRAVGKAYRLWNPDTRLLFLVRQEQNNNYLGIIKREGLWNVHCGADAYAQIDRVTGSNMSIIRDTVIDFKNDLSDGFWNDMNSHLSDLGSYLRW